MRCSSCSAENAEGAHFCGSCGKPLSARCPACGAENPGGFRFCGSCGAALESGKSARGPVAGERRRVTVLFADLVGFSTLAEHLDPEELRSFVGDTFGELSEAVESREGMVEKFIGDAVVAVFGAPITHEDDPARAVEAALAMLEVVRRRSQEAPTPLELRIGINSGLVVAGAVGDGSQTGVIGDAVNVAARLQQAAGPGEVLLSASTWRRVRKLFEVEAAGSLELKGREQPVEAHRLVGRLEALSQARAPFVGRREELALLDLLWSSVRKGNTHVVNVVGEPGVGKSRLVSEFRPDGASLEVRVTCGGERTFGPILDIVSHLLGASPHDAEELEQLASGLGIEQHAAAGLAALYGFGTAPSVARPVDEQKKRQAFAGVWQFLVAVTQDRPTVVVVDDVHWGDKSSLELLGFLLERIGGAPLMLVLCYRPGFEVAERAELRASHTAIRLEPLTPEESVSLARGILGAQDLPGDLERVVESRAGGNPFFVEELLQALLEIGSLEVVDGRVALATVELDVPDTVQGTILARLDRMSARERELLQHAAILGRGFRVELLEAVMGRGDVLGDLASLARAQVLVEVTPDEWAFKHDLIREVTHETLLLRRRRELHGKVADALESRVEEDPGHLEALAEHYARADVPEKARVYAVSAGDLAQARMGYAEAKRRYENALRLWGEGDEEGRLELLMKLAYAAIFVGDSTTARTAFIGAEEGWRALGDLRRAGAALAGQGRTMWGAGEAARGAEALDRSITLLEGLGPSPELVQAYAWLSALRMLEGDTERAGELASAGLPLAEQLGLRALRSDLLNTLGMCELAIGRPEGLDKLRESLELARESDNVESLGRSYTNLSEGLHTAGRLNEALEVAREGVELMSRVGHSARASFIAGNQAAILIDLGRLDEADRLAASIVDAGLVVLGLPGHVNAALPRVVLALRRGDYESARAILDEVIPLARTFGGVEFFAPTLVLESELELARGNVPAAKQSIREAVRIVFEATKDVYAVELLPHAVRLLPADEVAPLVERTRSIPALPPGEAARAEAEGLLYGDKSRLRSAADRYLELDMPYDEARCRLETGELERARELVERIGVTAGPLGSRLAALSAG